MTSPLIMVVQVNSRFALIDAADVDAAALAAFRLLDGKSVVCGGGVDGELAGKARGGDAAAAMRLLVRWRGDGKTRWMLERLARPETLR